MIKSYKLRIYPNENKRIQIQELLESWTEEVNKFINEYWYLPSPPKETYPPKELMPFGVMQRTSAIKAWQIVKGAKISEQEEKPKFDENEIDLNTHQIKFISHVSKSFDFWFKLSTLTPYCRIAVPAKMTSILRKALIKGILRKSAKILRKVSRGGSIHLYLVVFVDVPEKPSSNTKRIGVDLGLNNSVVTSDGKFLGQDVQEVRKRTKHRKYEYGPSAQKHSWNKFVKELVRIYPNYDFVVENLVFKGKRKRTKSFRRKYNTWAYKTLSRRLGEVGRTEGFKVIQVNPSYTSQTCPSCRSQDPGNRRGEVFKCLECGHASHADIVGAMNILSSSDRVPRVLSTRKAGNC